MTRNRIAKRRRLLAQKPPDVVEVGFGLRRERGVCRECHTLCDLVRGLGLCLPCFVKLGRRAG